jgi:alkylhydroperoxidase family enzyme
VSREYSRGAARPPVTQSALKPREPTARDLPEPKDINAVQALPAARFDSHQPRGLELFQVSRRRRPAAFEAIRDLTRGHRAAVEQQHEQNLATGFVRKGRKDEV